jgi:hypothetical protein
MKSTRRKPKLVAKPNREPKLSRTHAPVDLSPVDWQRGLRRQFGREQAFGLENLTDEPFFSEFRVSNPVSEVQLSRRDSRLGAGRQFLFLPRLGAQFVAALAAANDPKAASDPKAPAHPWIERDPITGAQSLKMPLPPPETARQLANALYALADGLRGKIA